MELKDIRAFVCVPGVGKSYLANTDPRFVDMDQMKVRYKYAQNFTQMQIEQNKGLERKTVNHNSVEYIKNKTLELLRDTNKILLYAPNPDIVEMLVENKIPYCLVYVSLDCKEEIRMRMKNRGNSDEFIERMLGPLESFYAANVADTRPVFKIELQRGEYLSSKLIELL